MQNASEPGIAKKLAGKYRNRILGKPLTSAQLKAVIEHCMLEEIIHAGRY